MPSIEQLESWSKYEKEVDRFVAIKQMDDEILFKAMASCSELLTGYADNVKHFARRGELGAIENSLINLRGAMEHLNEMVKDAKERAMKNG